MSTEFSKELFNNAGFLLLLMQKLNLQGINIIEISSTFTEFTFYIEEKDLQNSFEILHNCFILNK